MNKNQKAEEKICVFSASDYHFEMISLPYINKNLEENKEIIVLTEKSLEETIKTLVSRMNLSDEKKKKIFNIDWKNNDLDKFKTIKEDVEKNKEIILFIKGNENYIKNINENIKKWTEKSSKIKIIDCYDLEEISGKINNVINEYKMILNITGEKEIEKK